MRIDKTAMNSVNYTTYYGSGANKVWLQALQHIIDHGSIQEGRDQRTKEALFARFIIKEPRQRYITMRTINPAFAIAEVVWILSYSRNLKTIAWWNRRMEQYSDDGVTLHGAYGDRIITNGLNKSQLVMAYDALKDNPNRRDVVIQIWNSRRDMPLNHRPRAKDIPCNITAHPMIRDGKLYWSQVMRSNDLIWGTPVNFIQWTTIQEIMAGWLEVEVGDYIHHSDSLHIYERHWEHANKIIDTSLKREYGLVDSDLRLPFDEWNDVFQLVYSVFLSFPDARDVTDVESLMNVQVPKAYRDWLRVMASETVRKLGGNVQARNYAEAIDNKGLRLSMMQWLGYKEKNHEIN